MGQFGNQPDFATNDVKVITTANGFISDTPSFASFLNGAVIYVGDNVTTGTNLSIIPAGTVGVQGVVSSTSLISGGSGYTAGVGQATTSASGLGTGLTVTTTVVAGTITVATIVVAGTGYRQGDIMTVAGGLNGQFRINVTDSLPVLADGIVFKGLGTGGFLPVTVDYVLATGTTVSSLISAR
jgi:hypothetical protein